MGRDKREGLDGGGWGRWGRWRRAKWRLDGGRGVGLTTRRRG